MKKVLACFVALMIFVSSCQKESSTPLPKTSDPQLMANLQDISNSYQVANGEDSRALPKWLKTVLKDLVGGLEGAGLGSFLGPWGELGGGIIGAANGSFGAAVANPPGGTIIGPSVPVNGNNYFDHVGAIHNATVVYMFNNMSSFTNSNGSVNNAATYTYTKAVILNDNVYSVPPSDIISQSIFANWVNTFVYPDYTTQGFDAYLSAGVSSGKFTQQESNVLSLYYATISGLTTAADVQSYSVQTENAVNNSGLPQSSKDKLMRAMAITRYSASLWITNY